MMRWLLLAMVSVALSVGQAQAQSYIRVTNCGDGAPPAGASQGYMDSKGNICTDASNGGGGAVTIADGADVTLGAKADAKSTATDTTPITLMSVAKQISASVQAMVTSLAGTLTVSGTVTPAIKTITWIAPTSASITTSGTVVAAGPAVSVITNVTAAGGGTLTLNLFGGTAVANVGVPLQPGASTTVTGQPVGTAITGICSTGTCTVGIQSGS